MKITTELSKLTIAVSLVVAVVVAGITWGITDSRCENRYQTVLRVDTIYRINKNVVMDAFIYGWKAGRTSVIKAVNSTGGVINPDTVHKQIEAAFSRDTVLFYLRLKIE